MTKQKVINQNLVYGSILLFLSCLPYLILIGFKKNLILGSPDTDMSAIEVPMRSFAYSFLSGGSLPLWNPYLYCGIPVSWPDFLYPLNLLHLFLSIPVALNLLIVLHQGLAGIFMYLYLKHITQDATSSFLGATVFILSSVFITRIYAGHITVISVITWMPLLFLLIDRALSTKKIIFTLFSGLILSLQIISGHIQIVFVVLVGLFAYAIYSVICAYMKNKSLSTSLYPLYILSIIVFLGAGISAVKILSLIEQAKETIRMNNITWNYSFSMPPESIITLICPGFFGWMHKNIYWGKWFPWEVALYVGILPLLLSFLAILKPNKHSRFFAGLFLASLVLALGAYLPAREFIFKHVLGYNLFRASGRFLILGAFSLSVLTACGLSNLKNNTEEALSRKNICLFVIFASILFLVLFILRMFAVYGPALWVKMFSFMISYDKVIVISGWGHRYLDNYLIGNTIAQSSLDNSIIFLCLGVSLIVFYIRRWLNKNIIIFLIFAVIVADLLSFGCKYYSVFSPEDSHLDKEAAAFLEQNIGHYRYIYFGAGNSNAGLINRVSSMGGYWPLVPKRINEFINFTQGYSLTSPLGGDNIRLIHPMFALMNLKYILVGGSAESIPLSFTKVYSNKNISVIVPPFVLPKAFIASQVKVIQHRDDIFKALADASFDFKDRIIVEESPNVNNAGNSASRGLQPDPVFILYSPNKVVLSIENKRDGYLVLCDNYYPGWEAYVDGKKTRTFPADYIFRAVFLKPGNHTVRFVYMPLSFKPGLFITLSFLIFLSLWLYRVYKKKNLCYNK